MKKSELQQCLAQQSLHINQPPIVKDGLFVRKKEGFQKLLYSDILWIEASRSYSYIHFTNKPSAIVTFPLSKLEEKLPASDFIRIHRSYMININHIDGFIGNMLCIGKQKFPVSRRNRSKVFSMFLVLDSDKELLYEAP